MFKVVPDQLRISDGWVRCGQCDEVFDANVHLYTNPDTAPVFETPPAEIVEPSDDVGVSSLQFDASTDVEVSVVDLASDSIGEESRVELESLAEEIDLDVAIDIPEVEVPAVHALDQVMDLSPGLPPDSLPQLEKVPEAAVAEAPLLRYAQAQVKTNTSADPSKLSFMRQGRTRSLWQHIAVRLSLGLLSLVLLVALALQVVVMERDQIAAAQPDSRAPLDVVCEVVGCQIQPLRKIDAVVIDSSAFTKIQGDVYRLNFTLKSTAPVPVAVPAVELTLTDMQDQAVLRRVVQSSELTTSKTMLDVGSEMSLVLPLRVKTAAGEERVSGYRLLAFYP